MTAWFRQQRMYDKINIYFDRRCILFSGNFFLFGTRFEPVRLPHVIYNLPWIGHVLLVIFKTGNMAWNFSIMKYRSAVEHPNEKFFTNEWNYHSNDFNGICIQSREHAHTQIERIHKRTQTHTHTHVRRYFKFHELITPTTIQERYNVYCLVPVSCRYRTTYTAIKRNCQNT